MSPACFAAVTWQGAILDAFVRHVDPSLIYVHLHPACGKAIHRRAAVLVVTAAAASLISEMRVDVMGLVPQERLGALC